jgi:peptidyl-prolyl cis-trans isomerase A (cyclophilin A)
MNRNIILLIALFFGFSASAQTSKLDDGLYANMKTTKGDILIKLEFEKVPMTVANFVGLAEGNIKIDTFEVTKPYYNNVVFHRVVPNFVIQAGQPSEDGEFAGRQGGPGYKFPDEFDSTLKHSGPGILSMANAGAGTNGSQFFITHRATPHLDFRHSVFGSVISGQNIVDSIAQETDKINTIEILRVGKAAKKFDAAGTFEKTVMAKNEEALRIQQEMNAEFKKTMSEAYPNATQTESGLMYEVVQKGDGTFPGKSQKVSVHYTGTFVDGKKFDSSHDRGKPIEFALGHGRVIKGWDEGIQLCDVGGKLRLIIPYWIAYGEHGKSSIPPKATLIFDVELVGIK